ncbi:hypothetical protein K438DRAFT_1965976 [Mycena galopus ATCC 62051]|nr:hypothetical protein K438DRAFT_1965976 [Mycena galopus ATCC 62051]
MDAERKTLIEDTYYLGVPEIRNKVTWKKIRRDYKLVTTESVAADTACIEEATKATKEKNINNEKSDNETELQIDTTSLLVPTRSKAKHIKDIEEMENWPVGANPQAREAIEEMKYTHRVRRVPAYDIGGKLIHPLQYRESRSETLMGAIVRATVTLKHWNIAQPSQDSYTADIKNIRVLMQSPKLPAPVTSSKVIKTDPGSPSKKRRT